MTISNVWLIYSCYTRMCWMWNLAYCWIDWSKKKKIKKTLNKRSNRFDNRVLGWDFHFRKTNTKISQVILCWTNFSTLIPKNNPLAHYIIMWGFIRKGKESILHGGPKLRSVSFGMFKSDGIRKNHDAVRLVSASYVCGWLWISKLEIADWSSEQYIVLLGQNTVGHY